MVIYADFILFVNKLRQSLRALITSILQYKFNLMEW